MGIHLSGDLADPGPRPDDPRQGLVERGGHHLGCIQDVDGGAQVRADVLEQGLRRESCTHGRIQSQGSGRHRGLNGTVQGT